MNVMTLTMQLPRSAAAGNGAGRALRFVAAAVLCMTSFHEPRAEARSSEAPQGIERRSCYWTCRHHGWSAGRCLRYCRSQSKDRDSGGMVQAGE